MSDRRTTKAASRLLSALGHEPDDTQEAPAVHEPDAIPAVVDRLTAGLSTRYDDDSPDVRACLVCGRDVDIFDEHHLSQCAAPGPRRALRRK